MYQSRYAQAHEDDWTERRARERQAFAHAIGLLELARDKGAGSREAIEAIVVVGRLWTFLLEDLVRADNALAPELRAGLISIGIWTLRECDRLRRQEIQSFAGLIDVSRTLAEALA
jgi:flagellar protein FlaF